MIAHKDRSYSDPQQCGSKHRNGSDIQQKSRSWKNVCYFQQNEHLKNTLHI